MNFNRPLILASNSPRRQQLMTDLGLAFSVKTLHTDESYPEKLPAREVAKYLATHKAEGFKSIIDREIVIAADTTVIAGDQLLGKPENEKEAFEMLSKLSGTRHEVISGVCIVDKNNSVSFDDSTEVAFKELSKEEIDYYIKNYKPFDKAGAYGIQEWIGMIGIQEIKGSYFNVVGLPVHKLYNYLIDFANFNL